MIGRSSAEIKRQAQRWARCFSAMGLTVEVVGGHSAVGGGSLPGATLPTWWVALSVPSPDAFSEQLRQGHPPVIARIENDRLVLDPRTVLPGQEQGMLAAIQHAIRVDNPIP
jgi:L-seryl-tRNA(Ser) seleniumtransferase